MSRDLPPVHPSEILQEDFMIPFEITNLQLAESIKIPIQQLEDFLTQKKPLNANLALRLAYYFATDAQSWLNLQNHYDLEITKDALQDELKTTIKPFKLKNNQDIKVDLFINQVDI